MIISFKIKEKEIFFDTSIIKKILLVLLAIFCVINLKFLGAIFTNSFRFITGAAHRYEVNLEEFKNQIYEHKTSITLSNVKSSSELSRLCHQVLEGEPEIFYISDSMSWSEVSKNTYRISLSYKYSKEQLPALIEDFNNRIDDICSEIDLKWSDHKKALYIHDYIEKNYSYDYSYQIHDVYTMLLKNTGVCSAYAGLYKILCNKVGLKCEVVWTSLDRHTWNVIKINGLWYHVDVTWDDTGNDNKEYFLIPDILIWGSGHHQWVNCGKYKISCFSFIYSLNKLSVKKS